LNFCGKFLNFPCNTGHSLTQPIFVFSKCSHTCSSVLVVISSFFFGLWVDERTIVVATLSAFASKVGTKFLIHIRGEDRALRFWIRQVENPKLCTILDCVGLPTTLLRWGKTPTIGGVIAPTIGCTVGSTRTCSSVRLLFMLSRRGLDSRRTRLRYSPQDAVANCNRGANWQRGTQNYVPRVMLSSTCHVADTTQNVAVWAKKRHADIRHVELRCNVP